MLDLVEMAINNAPLVDTDLSPFYLTFGYHPTMLTDVLKYTGPDAHDAETFE